MKRSFPFFSAHRYCLLLPAMAFAGLLSTSEVGAQSLAPLQDGKTSVRKAETGKARSSNPAAPAAPKVIFGGTLPSSRQVSGAISKPEGTVKAARSKVAGEGASATPKDLVAPGKARQ